VGQRALRDGAEGLVAGCGASAEVACGTGGADGPPVRTHAVQPPCVFQLVQPPLCGDGGGARWPEVRGQLRGDRLRGQERAVGVEGEDELGAGG